MTKICFQCGEAKALSAFSKRAVAKDGHCPYCKQCGSEYQRRYYSANPEKLANKHRRFRRDSRETLAQRASVRYHSDPANAALIHRRWSDAHPGKYREHRNRWAAANREKIATKARNRHALRRGAPGTHTAADTSAIFHAQHGLCAYCLSDLATVKKHLDHRHPLSRGGSNGPGNLQWLCAPCNLAKGAKDPDEFEASLATVAS